MSRELFWNCKLSKSEKEYKFPSAAEDEANPLENPKLILRRAWIDPETSTGMNVVELESIDSTNMAVKLPLLYLGKENYSESLELILDADNTKFKLIKGDATVYLAGSIVDHIDQDYINGGDLSSDEEGVNADEDMDEEEVSPEKPVEDLRKKIAEAKAGEKRKVEAVKEKPPAKKGKGATNDDAVDSEDDDQSEEEESPPKKVAKKPTGEKKDKKAKDPAKKK